MIKATITEAGNMTDETYAYICRGVGRKFGDTFEFERITDKSIIGGFIVCFKGKVYDRSVSGQLMKMKEYISE